MNQEQLDKIREKLYDLQIAVDADVWKGISASLRRKRGMKLLYWASSAAAAVIAALIIFTGTGSEPEIGLMAEQQPQMQTMQYPVEQPGQEMDTEDAGAVEDAGTVGGAEPVKCSEVMENANMAEAVNEVRAVEVAETVSGDIEKSPVQEDAMPMQQTKMWQLLEMEEESSAGKYTFSINSGLMPGSSASVAGSAIRATSAGAGSISQSYMVEQISDTQYSLPLNLGVQVQIPLKHNMALGAGVNYTMLRSSYDCLINKKSYNVKQTLHYIGIPVNIYGMVVEKNSFRFYVNAGATIEKGVRAVYHLKSYDETLRSSSSIDGLQFSVNAGMGVEYRISNLLGLYLEPNIVYYMDSDVPRSIRTDQPLQVKAELGFRFNF